MIQIGSKKIRGIYINKEIIQTAKTSEKTFIKHASASITNSSLLSEYFNTSNVGFNGSRVRVYEGGVMKSKNPITYTYLALDNRYEDQWYNNMMVYEINIKPADPNLAFGYRVRIKNTFVNLNSTLSEYTIYDYKTGQTQTKSGEPVEVNWKYKGTGRLKFTYNASTKIYTLEIATTSGGVDLTLSQTTDYFIPMYLEIKGLSEISGNLYTDVQFNCIKGYRVD